MANCKDDKWDETHDHLPVDRHVLSCRVNTKTCSLSVQLDHTTVSQQAGLRQSRLALITRSFRRRRSETEAFHANSVDVAVWGVEGLQLELCLRTTEAFRTNSEEVHDYGVTKGKNRGIRLRDDVVDSHAF